MLTLKYIPKVTTINREEFISAVERIKTLRSSYYYSTSFETNFITVKQEGKDINGWIAECKLNIKSKENIFKIIETHQASAFIPVNNTEYENAKSGLGTAQTLALSRACAHAGIGLTAYAASADEVKKPIITNNTHINNNKGKVQEQDIPADNIIPDENNNASDIWEWIYNNEQLFLLFKDKNFKINKRTKALGLKIIENWNNNTLLQYAKKEGWIEKYPASLFAINYNRMNANQDTEENIDVEADIINNDKTAFERLKLLRNKGLKDYQIEELIFDLYPEFDNIASFARKANDKQFNTVLLMK